MAEGVESVFPVIGTVSGGTYTAKWGIRDGDVHYYVVDCAAAGVGVGEDLVDFGLGGTEDVNGEGMVHANCAHEFGA